MNKDLGPVEPNRAVSPVISVILMVAIAVILTATISIFVLGFTEDLNDTAPVVGQTSGEFEPGSGSDEQIVRITHVAGDRVNVENIEIIVQASGPSLDANARLVNLPADSHFSNAIDSTNVQGDDIIDTSNGAPNQVIVPADPNTWTAGDTIQFRIKVGGADFREPPDRTGPEADELKITIVYTDTESSAILFEETFRP
ncbi:type IV pilin N-terminal domain-containing protein [Haloarcula halophila]|uniref:type IV pilin N-terminal domain-containing protein n=1 Tax=Haloarcula TaxID=2237 RepID=UPI0023E400F2|nr:type IV pilin N-terminal domain-containing protein [Halomicroarcula sp. DFY41]